MVLACAQTVAQLRTQKVAGAHCAAIESIGGGCDRRHQVGNHPGPPPLSRKVCLACRAQGRPPACSERFRSSRAAAGQFARSAQRQPPSTVSPRRHPRRTLSPRSGSLLLCHTCGLVPACNLAGMRHRWAADTMQRRLTESGGLACCCADAQGVHRSLPPPMMLACCSGAWHCNCDGVISRHWQGCGPCPGRSQVQGVLTRKQLWGGRGCLQHCCRAGALWCLRGCRPNCWSPAPCAGGGELCCLERCC